MKLEREHDRIEATGEVGEAPWESVEKERSVVGQQGCRNLVPELLDNADDGRVGFEGESPEPTELLVVAAPRESFLDECVCFRAGV
jgi:hypothetical protein